MALYKRGKTWHADFSVNGERFRQSVETTDWREAQAKEKALIKAASDGKLHSARRSLAGEEFNAAVQPYLLERETEIQDCRHEAQLAKPLQRFFDKTRLRDIGAENVRAYQRSRLSERRHPATVNHEVKLLFRLLRRAKLLHILRDDVKLLSVPKVPRKMLTSEQKLRVFETASARPEWQLAYCAALLTANASLRPVELRRLCWQRH